MTNETAENILDILIEYICAVDTPEPKAYQVSYVAIEILYLSV